MAKTFDFLKDFYKDKSVVVTGAGGFIGSHLVEALSGYGADVFASFNYNSRQSRGNLENSKAKFTPFWWDIRESLDSRGFEDVKLVFHLAAMVDVAYSFENAASYLKTNVLGTHQVAEFCRHLPNSRMVHTSSSEVYGSGHGKFMSETHPLNPQSPYAASKVGADAIVHSLVAGGGLKAVTIRPFNTSGPRQSTRAVLPSIIKQIKAGGTIHLGSPHPVRSITHVLDTINGMLLAGRALWLQEERVLGQVINIGNECAYSVMELVNLAKAKCGSVQDVKFNTPELMRPKDVSFLLPNCRKARELLRWHQTAYIGGIIGDIYNE